MGKKSRLKALRKNLPALNPNQSSQRQIKVNLGNFDSILTISILSIVIISILSLAFTILKPGLPSGHDITAHRTYTQLFVDNLRQGQFPIRWTNWIKPGFDLPLFNFYQVGFYYLTALINTIIPSLTITLKIIILLLWWLGSLFMFLYARRFSVLGGGLAALLYAFTPYLISDIFVRAAYPEIMAITFSVGALWVLDRLLTTSKPIYCLPLALFSALVLISHLPSVIIMTPILAGYILLLTFNQEVKLKSFPQVITSIILGVGLSSFYLLPAIFELNLIQTSLLSTQYYDFHQHFVYPQQLFSLFWGYGISQTGSDDGMSFQLGIIQWIIIFSAILAFIYTKISNKNTRFNIYLVFWLVLILYAIFFSHDISISFWENIKSISFIQYPWRFLMVITLAVPSLAAVLLMAFPKSWQKAGIILATLLAIFVFYRNYLQPATFLLDNYFTPQNTYLEEGYLPKEVEQLPTKDINKWEIIKGKGQVEEKIIKAYQYQFVISSQEPLVFQLNSHFFPGWKAYLNNQEIKENHSSPYDFMIITVPTGINKVEFIFTNTLIRSTSNTITVLSLLALVLWQTFPFLSRRIQRVDRV